MEDIVKVTINKEVKEYPVGITLFEISKEHQKDYDAEILLAVMNKRLRELGNKIEQDADVDFITAKDVIGNKTYKRGATFIMLKAVYDVLGHDKVEKVQIKYVIDKGLYCQITSERILTEDILIKIKERMYQIVNEDILIKKRTIEVYEAIKLFEKYKMYDKQRLFKYRRSSKTNLYSIGNFEDYFYGYMPHSTKCIKYFDLCLYEKGFMLILPNAKDPTNVGNFKPQRKLFNIMEESDNWGEMLNIGTVGALNDEISKGNINDLILVQEALQEKKIGEIAAAVKDAHNKKFIMIAGPSSSGKTTFSHRLSIQLRALGLKPHPIAVDDYFLNREDTPLDEYGKPNFECIDAIDVEQFNKDMTDLMNGKTVELPSFNFKIGRREYKGNYKKLEADDILVIEGIHGLNENLSHNLPEESKYKIYISALTQVNVDEHNRIPTTDARLIRRIVRDARTRGTKAQDTIAMWNSVRRGEEENIFPFQEEADVMFNSALIYELLILKQFAEPLLFGIDNNQIEYVEAKRLLKFLDYFLGVSSEDVPKNSILREFIGGSCFKV